MTSNKIIRPDLPAWGQDLLQSVPGTDPVISSFKAHLQEYQFSPGYPEDPYIWAACVLALQAASLGNFGVGSIVVDPAGDIPAWGHNEVFIPYFSSNKHAEMVTMDRLESTYKNLSGFREYRLYTSVEPCPMCLTRLITSGIGTVVHASWDPPGGMVNKIRDLPQAWAELSLRQVFRFASCSPVLAGAAQDIFEFQLDDHYRKLRERP